MLSVDPKIPATKPAPEPAPDTPARRALYTETSGLILVALVILVVYLVRYFHLLHRSTP